MVISFRVTWFRLVIFALLVTVVNLRAQMVYRMDELVTTNANIGNVTAGTIAAQYMIDSNDGAFFVDPASTSQFSGLNVSAQVSSTKFLSNNGSATVPSFSSLFDTDTGVYFSAANQMTFTAGGTAIASVSTSGLNVAGTTTSTGFSGSGASLTALPAAQLTGTLPQTSLNTYLNYFIQSDTRFGLEDGTGGGPSPVFRAGLPSFGSGTQAGWIGVRDFNGTRIWIPYWQ